MNATLTIQVRVMGMAAAAQLKAVQKQVNALNAAAANVNKGPFGRMGASVSKTWAGIRRDWERSGATFARTIKKLDAVGQSLRRSGQQITFGFTLPFVLAAGAATKWALDNEKAMTRVKKVYGDGSIPTGSLNRQMGILDKYFTSLSGIFGKARSEVTEIGASLAAIGLVGTDLMEGTRAALEVMVLGDMDATQATDAIVGLATVWKKSLTPADAAKMKFSEVKDALAILNAVENQTAAGFSDLTEGFTRAAGVAQSSGVTIQEFAGFLAALVPVSGSAAAAGNGLKGIFSRLAAPTNEASASLEQIGINIRDIGWTSSTMTEKVFKVAEAFEGLSDAQRAVSSSDIFGKYQLNRADLMLKAVHDSTMGQGFYKKALDASADSTKSQATYTQELNTLLDSNPQKLATMGNVLKNNIADVAVQFIPVVIGLVAFLAKLAEKFNSLSQKTKGWVIMIMALVAALGPVLMLLGVLVTTLKFVFQAMGFVSKMVIFLGKQLFKLVYQIYFLIRALILMAVDVITKYVIPALTQMARAVWNSMVAFAKFALEVTKTMLTLAKNLAIIIGQIIKQFVMMGIAIIRVAAKAVGKFALETTKIMITLARNIAIIVGQIIKQFVLMATGIIRIGAKAFIQFAKTAIMSLYETMKATAKTLASVIVSFIKVAAAAIWSAITTAVAWISGLTPAMVSAATGVIMASIGMITSFFGVASAAISAATATAIAWLSVAAPGVAAAAAAIGGAIAAIGIPLWAIVAIVAAVIGLIVLIFNKGLRDKIWNVMKSIGRAIWALPKVFMKALRALGGVVSRAVKSITDMLSYLNPFARHSPSLVDNVKAGISTILDEYDRLKGISKTILAATAAHQKFQDAISGVKNSIQAQETADDRQTVAEVAPQALPSFDEMVSLRIILEQDLIPLSEEINKQSIYVAQLNDEYQKFDKSVAAAQSTLDKLKLQLDKVNQAIEDSRNSISDYASMGITGMAALSDEVFANEMAQKRLKLAIMDLEDAGQSIENVTDMVSRLNAEMELLKGDRRDLYLQGAGSDILSAYDDQIAALELQRDSISESGSAIGEMAKQLEELGRQATRMDLEGSIRFDEPLRQIEQLATEVKELPFETVIVRIQELKTNIDNLLPSQQAMNASVESQAASLEQMNLTKDGMAEKLEAESEILSSLEDAYSSIKDLIEKLDSSMAGFVQTAEEAQRKGKEAADAFGDALLEGDFAKEFGNQMWESFADEDAMAKMGEDAEKEIQKVFDEMEFTMPEVPDPFGWVKRNLSKSGLMNVGREIEKGLHIEGAMDSLKRNFSTEGLSNIGNDIIHGIGGGITSALDWLEDINWAWPEDHVIQPIKDFFGIASPSTLMAEIGGNLIDGLKNGITGAMTSLWETVKGVASGVWQTIQSIFWSIVAWVDEHIIPAWNRLRDNVRDVFDSAKEKVKEFWDDNVKPKLDAIQLYIDETLIPVWNRFKDKINDVFDSAKAKVKEFWDDNVKPKLDAVKAYIDDTLIPAWNRFKASFTSAFDAAKAKVKEFWDDNVKPKLDAIASYIDITLVPAWNRFRDGVKEAWTTVTDWVGQKAKAIANFAINAVNTAIDAFNKLGGGLKSVAGAIGISINFTDVQGLPLMLAKGGMATTDAGGGLYAGARAIVGEGSKIWPEYVIPTDPKYRDRAVMLAQAAGERIGMFAKGGVVTGKGSEDQSYFGKALEAVGNVGGSAMDLAREAKRIVARGLFAPIKAAMEMILGGLPDGTIKNIARSPIKMVEDFINNAVPEFKGDPSILEAARGMSGSFPHLIAYLESTGVFGIAGSTVRPGATTAGSGHTRASLHASGRAVDFFPKGGGVDNQGLLDIYQAFLPVKNILAELIYSGPGGSNPKNPITARDHHNHVHTGLAMGGISPVGAGGDMFAGVRALVGEGSKVWPEFVIPTDPRHRGRALGLMSMAMDKMNYSGASNQISSISNGMAGHSNSNSTININGDLSFPNITSPDDAKAFIDNLKAVAS